MLTPEDADTTECWFEDDMLVLVINWQDGGYSEITFDFSTITGWSYTEAGC
tara:strand:- start:885 stop:1037 length:153 start_codon:yes stop_codon:yes gene_type:complete